MNKRQEFFKFVIPSIIAFALSGIYAIVDGFFVGNTIGDVGLSAINIAYPIVAVLQAIGTGIGMGGAVHYSISCAQKKESEANQYISVGWWILIVLSVIITTLIYAFAGNILTLLGASNIILKYATDYIRIIALGAVFQILGTGLIPFIRNYGGSLWAMIAMLGGFVTNIILDFTLVWLWNMGMKGAAAATVIGQAVTMLIAICYSVSKRKFYLRIYGQNLSKICGNIIKVGIAPFGLALTPNISLVLINRFSASYGGEKAIATYACISYIICIIYLVLQGVGDGSQPLMSKYYGSNDNSSLKSIQKMAYLFAFCLAVIGIIIMFLFRTRVGTLFGSSEQVNAEIARIMPIFLISIPFVAVTRIATATFYATERSVLSYILTFVEPVLMLILMLILPHFGGQIMIWWSTVFARIISALLAAVLAGYQHKKGQI